MLPGAHVAALVQVSHLFPGWKVYIRCMEHKEQVIICFEFPDLLQPDYCKNLKSSEG
jgi:hypothetical protein